jgi:beige protein homolog 1
MITSNGKRHRSVSATSTAGPEDEELRNLVNALNDVDDDSFHAFQTSLEDTGSLQRLRHTLVDQKNPREAQSAFRRVRGFQALLGFLSTYCTFYGTTNLSEGERREFFSSLKEALNILGTSVQEHAGNQKYFDQHIDGGGWQSLHKILDVVNERLCQDGANTKDMEQLYGMLLATSLGDQTISEIYTTSRRAIENSSIVPTDEDGDGSSQADQALRQSCKMAFQGVDGIYSPNLLPILLKLWSDYLLTTKTEAVDVQVLARAIPASLLELVSSSRQNVVAAHTAGLLTAVLPFLDDTHKKLAGSQLFKELALKLCEEGVPSLDDAYTLYSRASTSSRSAAFLLETIRASRKPPSIHFDLSLHGYCSIEFPTLGKSFPPLDTGGYTLAVWARFDSFDPNIHTTIFGAFDSSQTCFILAYLEKDSRHFILQTSIRGAKPSVRFKSIAFEQGRWYHICIVHRRPRTISSPRASLFVDGEFVEQVKAGYPNAAPLEGTNKRARIQAFFGTPHDLAPNLSKGACTSSWSLASSTLFQEALSDDLVAVFYHLGPRYHGNFQDCLGSFQTYSASAALNLRNETLNPAKQDNSDIIMAIRQKASSLIPEALILLNISPSTILDSDDRNNIDESQLVKSLSKQAAKNLQLYIRSGSNAVAINGAVPAINDALTQAHGVAILTGDPVVATPQSLEDASWRMGGCAAVGLSLVNLAKTTEDVLLAVEILFETVQHNWRNSEAMERENGYAILAAILRDKLGFNASSYPPKPSLVIPTSKLDRNDLALRLLKLILDFVGYDLEAPRNSVINNPLAYRILLVDTDIWRSAGQAVQEVYFGQFVTFGVESQHYRFNAKRLARMRVLKKLLEALKSETVLADTMPFYMMAFKSLFPSAMSAEMLRSLALFITFSVHKGKITLQPKKSINSQARSRHSPRNRSDSDTSEGFGPYLTHFEIGVEVLKLYSEFLCSKDDTSSIKKFAKTVTNKWLLYLMSETSPEVVVLSTRILARLIVVHGTPYLNKFKEKSGGFTIMRHRLKRWWHLPALWPACFAILFGIDVGTLDLDRSFDLFGLLELFDGKKEVKVTYPDVLEVIMGMLQNGLKTIVQSRMASASDSLRPDAALSSTQSRQRLSMSTMSPPDPLLVIVADHHVETLNTAIRFLADLHTRSQNYRDFAASSSYVQDILFILFPVVVGSDAVSADIELNARDSTLTFDGEDVLIRPISNAPPIVRTANIEPPKTPTRGQHLRRGSSFVLVTSEHAKHQPSESRLNQSISPLSPTAKVPQLNDGHVIVQSLLEIVISVFVDQILARKEFSGLGLFSRTPPGFLEHRTYFESWVLRNTLSQLSNSILLNQSVLCEPKVLTNLARLFSHVGEAWFEGWFIGGADSALDFAGSVLEYLQRPDIASVKSVRLCSQAVSVIRAVVFRTVLLCLSQVEDSEVLPFLQKLTYWQTVLLASEDSQSEYLRLICYLLYGSLISSQEAVRMAAANLWRIILVQKQGEALAMFNHATSSDHHRLAASFEKLLELDNETFLYWVDDHRHDLDSFFFDVLSKSWDSFTAEENKKTDESSRQRLSKRREKLKQWHRTETDNEEIIRRHEVTFDHWTSNIYASERQKHQRVTQDQQDNMSFTIASFERMQRDAKGPLGFLGERKTTKWRLDQTEGRNRMRLRLKPDTHVLSEDFQPRIKGSEAPTLRVNTQITRAATAEAISVTPGGARSGASSPKQAEPASEPFPDLPEESANDDNIEIEESFELVEDPQEDQEDYEDRNRKVMRSLNRGDQVKQVANISRIVGLEAVEGLLILGKDYLYLMDNFFQRADGEIVNVWQAPQQERDPYVRMISGRETGDKKSTIGAAEHVTRSWKWTDIISVSKRRFLFRDVALELFFADGRSYLLTVMSPTTRNELHSTISAKAPQYISGATSLITENLWRFESLRSPEEEPKTLGTKFANVFGQVASTPATRKWQKGEISNFHYLMLVNTMAGRTYNDLTQYPVFPWVLADYTSEELDLSDPKTFRDLSKPMGCQTPEREAEFKERYKSFAEMGDDNSPAFHYGTHYSSAMIVTSYLIRLQPFVKSYLLLQGGSFDHPDRMFYSMEKAWNSASRMNMTDVRELTPEFFNLPEFLVNVNGYNFGTRQGSSKTIDKVELPPWAKGDPKIFIAKHREALESPHVSQNLHKWIDLVFGYKQRGEAALEAVNVFHHLSYQGAKDLDNITDPMERLATIGIIHNFGQTPHQVFQKPHAAREETRHKYKRLDTAAESLTRLPFNLLDSEERVSSLLFSWKQERLLCSAAFRLNIPPLYDKYMEWGFSDGSIRFYSAESRKLLGHFEHLHIGQLSCATFADSKTLITAGTDCAIAVWNITNSSKSVDIQPRSCLFGHRTPVTVLALSRSFSALVSASTGGEVFLWDLNRLECVRKVDEGSAVDCASINDITGNIVLCRGSRISMYTLNADLLLHQDAGEREDDTVISCACYEGAGNEWLERDILLTGHKRGIVKVWSKVIRGGKFELELVRQLNHVDASREDGGNVTAGISCILPMPQVVYTGDEDGRVVCSKFFFFLPSPLFAFAHVFPTVRMGLCAATLTRKSLGNISLLRFMVVAIEV